MILLMFSVRLAAVSLRFLEHSDDLRIAQAGPL
jgi:hypothetical protein